jgi:hypothetical protein
VEVRINFFLARSINFSPDPSWYSLMSDSGSLPIDQFPLKRAVAMKCCAPHKKLAESKMCGRSFSVAKKLRFWETESSLDHRDDLTAMLSSLLLNPQDPKSWNWPRLETEVRRVVSARSV